MKKIYAFIALAMSTVGFAQTTITKQMSEFGFTNSQTFPSGSLDNNVSFTTQKGSSSTDPAYFNTGNNVRLYTGTGGIGGSITLAFTGGITVTSVSITTTASYSPTANLKIDGGAATSVTATNNTYTISGLTSTSSLFLQNAGSSQLRITSVSVTYNAAVVANPVLAVTPTSLTGLNYVQNEGPSQSQSFSVSGTDLNGSDVVITAPTNFEVSSDNTTFATTATLTAFNGTATNVYARLATGLAVNTYSGNVTIAGGGATTEGSVAVSGEVSTPLSTEKNNIEGLKVYPNPASDVVNISSSLTGIKEVSIFNMLGKKVLETSTNETINISNLTSGVYIMNISQDGKTASKKLVVK